MRGLHYSIHDNKSYFITCTVVEWIDIFTRKNHKDAIIESLKYCQQHKGLNIYAWCLMPSHLHMLVNTDEPFQLADVIRDFKKNTSKKIISLIQTEPESRREWLLQKFSDAGKDNKKIKYYKFWQEGNHAMEVYSEKFTWQKIDYIYNNPVEEGIVDRPEEYLMSSARNYAGQSSVLDVHCLVPPIRTV